MRTARPLAAAALSAAALCALTACGSGGGSKDAAPSAPAAASVPAASPSPTAPALADLTAAEIAQKSRDAGEKLKSVTMTITVPGYPGGAFDGTFTEGGDGSCHGTFSIKGQGAAEIVRVGTDVWLKPDADYLKNLFTGAPAGAAGKWITSGNTTKDKAYFCDLGVQLEKRVGLHTDGNPVDGVAKGGSKQVDGAPAVVLTMTDDFGKPVRYDIAAEGEPRLLVTETGTGDMVVKLGDFDKPVQAAAPAANQVFQR
ncbi:hypothetical protein HUT16_18605 [Kitasatospora sp. NA04385]|uniref:hypothetical protein n=1 Tax=Kitasatospora sp. NA04385 TaxID=2742135 RepID=UPI001591C664|nr:hypothetical protein [Kitasatospora sp. NA04385]QKW20804.1 hypothetical protein HUT16_18605 [Kitasatospora sp. NA04385]